MPQKWSKEIVVSHILKRHRGGEKLNSGYVQVHVVPLYQSACQHFGSWRKAIEAAGLTYEDVRVKERSCPVWSREKIIATIRRMHSLGQPLNSNHIQTKEKRIYGAANKYFGGWPEAIEAAGLNYSKLRRKNPMRSWSQEAIVSEIIRRQKVGLSIRGGDVCLEDEGLYKAAKRYFGKGGWAKARVLGGFDPVDPKPFQIWNEETVCKEIQQLHENGVALNTGSLQKSPYSYVLGAGCKVFGTWKNAVSASGLDYSKIRKIRKFGWWTKPRVLMGIRNLEQRGVRLSHQDMRYNHGDLLATAIHLFGSWSQAVEAAGISYRQHCRVWSAKAYVRRLNSSEYEVMLEKAQHQSVKRRRK